MEQLMIPRAMPAHPSRLPRLPVVIPISLQGWPMIRRQEISGTAIMMISVRICMAMGSTVSLSQLVKADSSPVAGLIWPVWTNRALRAIMTAVPERNTKT